MINDDKLKHPEKYKTSELVINQVDCLIETYSTEKSDRFWVNDLCKCLIAVGAGFSIDAYYHFDNHITPEKLKEAFCKEVMFYQKHYKIYVKSDIIQSRLAKLKVRIEKMFGISGATAAKTAAKFADIYKQIAELKETQQILIKQIEELNNKN